MFNADDKRSHLLSTCCVPSTRLTFTYITHLILPTALEVGAGVIPTLFQPPAYGLGV